jgi:hypothetical protein
LNTEYDPVDGGTYLDALLADYDSDNEEPDSEIVLPEMEQPTVQSPRDEREVRVPENSTESRAASCVRDCADMGWPAGGGVLGVPGNPMT